MGEFLSYSMISGFLLLAMYLTYRLFLARDNQHSFNRSVLLLIYLVSFLAVPVIYYIANLKIESSSQIVALEGIEVVSATATPLSKPLWGTVLIWIFLAGMIVVAVKTAVTWGCLVKVIRSGKKIEHNGYTLVVTNDERFAPFSWMRYVVMSRTDYADNCSAIAIHERTHVVSCHWIDLLIAQVVCIMNWFNPAAWLMRDELMLVHEYQADMAVIDSGHNPQEYQMLLIKKAVGSRFPSLANSLNHSKLKKRITMMYKEKSSVGRKFKALALVPMLALALGVVAVPAVRAAVSAISSSDVSFDKGSEKPQQDKIKVQYYKVTNINNDGHETTVVIKGENIGNNLTVSGGTLTTNGKSYHAKSLQCNMTDGTATITVKFPFSGEYKTPGITLTINGEEVPFNLEEFFNNAQTIKVGDLDGTNTTTFSIVVNGNSSNIPKDMAIFLDGEQISEAEMRELSPEDIVSVSVSKKENAIRITTNR